jgi:hypothetical protein
MAIEHEKGTVRLVAGLSVLDGEPSYHVFGLVEKDGVRQGEIPAISGMSEEQAEHLWMQLGRALGKTAAFEENET